MQLECYQTIRNSIKRLLLLGFVIATTHTRGQSLHEDVDLEKIPPRIIRACCAFGYDLKLWGVPFVSVDQVIGIDDLGEHHYMGKKSEGVGTVYTRKGGFIDIGHLRDQIDWTRFLYLTILNHKGKGGVKIALRKEAGRKTLHLNIPAEFDNRDCMTLAGKIAYDLSLWHEISTWFGSSTIPLVPEKFSSFSVEDVYSNLLGIHVGMKALDSKQPFNEAATKLIASTLDSLAVVKSAEETYKAYNAVHNAWYTSEKRIPRTNVTLERELNVLQSARPWLVTSIMKSKAKPVVLDVPLLTAQGESLTNFYRLNIDLNKKIPVKELFPNRQNRRINQDDFEVLLKRISRDLKVMEDEALVRDN